MKKKLIEVALPLEAINAASAREKSIRHGHPSTLHLWWARRPLAAARAVIFAQMVDDPSAYPELFPTEKAREKERRRLFRIIEALVKWESTTDEAVLLEAREEIWRSWRRTCAENADHPKARELFNRHRLPGFQDPFAGGGALPLEAQRLGLDAHASDLNPVAVLINKAMIEIPARFAGRPPINPQARTQTALQGKEWVGAQGLADDVRYYGRQMRNKAKELIGHLYPDVLVTAEMAQDRPDLKRYVGRKLTVIAWIWARTVKSPNPAFADVEVPLASTFMLSTRPGNEAYVEPVIEERGYRFNVRVGKPENQTAVKVGTKLARGANFRCIMSNIPISADYIKAEGQGGRIGTRLIALVAEGERERVYLSPMPDYETTAKCQAPSDVLIEEMPSEDTANFWCTIYGLKAYRDLFTPRQLVALTTFSDLIKDTIQDISQDAAQSGLAASPVSLAEGGGGAVAYAEAVGVYLAFALDRVVDRHTSIATWDSSPSKLQLRNTFARQAIPMTWDFGEGNPFCTSSGTWSTSVEWVSKCLEILPAKPSGFASQADASSLSSSVGRVASTDPPYYDNIGYADLSDFFYVWLRRSLRHIYPNLFSTLTTPKAEELVATPFRHGNKLKAEAFFLDGMTRAMQQLAEQSHPAFPVTIYYAFKQSESESAGGISSTGWETFLDAVISAGFGISGTWPVRTELGNRMIGRDTNALASSIVLVCRKRQSDARAATRREFVGALRRELPDALRHLQAGNIAPVDLAQAAIGPGMAVFTRYSRVLEQDGSQMVVRSALALINQALDEVLAEQDGEFDPDTRCAVAWFEQHAMDEGPFGQADVLSRAKNTSVQGLVNAGILEARAGKVRLLRREELPMDWNPAFDQRITVWEVTQHLIRALLVDGSEEKAARILQQVGALGDAARDLAYRLYGICERKRWAQEAIAYNSLVVAGPVLRDRAQTLPAVEAQTALDL